MHKINWWIWRKTSEYADTCRFVWLSIFGYNQFICNSSSTNFEILCRFSTINFRFTLCNHCRLNKFDYRFYADWDELSCYLFEWFLFLNLKKKMKLGKTKRCCFDSSLLFKHEPLNVVAEQANSIFTNRANKTVMITGVLVMFHLVWFCCSNRL